MIIGLMMVYLKTTTAFILGALIASSLHCLLTIGIEYVYPLIIQSFVIAGILSAAIATVVCVLINKSKTNIVLWSAIFVASYATGLFIYYTGHQGIEVLASHIKSVNIHDLVRLPEMINSLLDAIMLGISVTFATQLGIVYVETK